MVFDIMKRVRPVGLAAAGVAMAALLAGSPASQAKVEGDTITLGAPISLSGKYTKTGTHMRNGYELAIKRINEMGGVKVDGKSYKLKLAYYDDESKPARGAQLAERLIKEDGIQFMLGPYSSGLTKAVAPVVERYRIPMVEANGAARTLFSKGYKYMFAVLSTSNLYLSTAVDLAAETAKKNGKKPSDVTIAVAIENDPFSHDIRAGVLEKAREYGMTVVIDDKLRGDLSDMSSTLSKVRSMKPDLLIVTGHSKGADTAARQMGEMGITAPIVGITHCEAAGIVKKYGSATEGILCPTQWSETLSYKDRYMGSAADYHALYQSTYPEFSSVPFQAAQSSAAVLVWKNAFEKANSFDTEKLRDALAATDMKTFYGPIKFSPQGNNIAKPMVLRQIQNGQFKVVAPAKWASDPFRFPRSVGG